MNLSVVIPTFNEERGEIERTVASVVETDPCAEVIVVDDCGSDPVSPIDGAIIHRLDRNMGPGGAVAAGFARASGELLARVDVGDVWFPESKREQIRFAQDHRATFSGALDEEKCERWPLPANWRDLIWRENQFQASTTVFHRSVLNVVPHPALRFASDWAFHSAVEFHIGWAHFDVVTGMATCWPDGHTRTLHAQEIESERMRDLGLAFKAVNYFRLQIRNGKWRGNPAWAARQVRA